MLFDERECYFCKTILKKDDKLYSFYFNKGEGTITALACKKCGERKDLEKLGWKKC